MMHAISAFGRLENLLSGDLYVEAYDALSLSAVETQELSRNDLNNSPKMEGLRKLCIDTSRILNDAQLVSDASISKLKKDLIRCDRLRIEINERNEKKRSSVFIPDREFDDEEDAFDLEETLDKSNAIIGVVLPIDKASMASNKEHCNDTNQEWEDHVNLINQTLLSQLKYDLQLLYADIIKLIDQKMEILLIVLRIIESYKRRIISIAVDNNITSAALRAQIVVDYHFSAILGHKFFGITEESRYQESVSSIWAVTFLGSVKHAKLATRLLSTQSLLGRDEKNKSAFYWKAGSIGILLIGALIECIANEIEDYRIWNDPLFSYFMVFGNLLLLLLMWGVCIYIWNGRGINYVRLLQLQQTEFGNPRRGASHADVFNTVGDLIIIYLLTFVLYNKLLRSGYIGAQYTHLVPLLMTKYFIFRLVWPLNSREVWWSMLGRVLAAPFYPIIFRDGFIGDLLTSLVRVSVPMSYSVAYIAITLYGWLMNRMDLVMAISDEKWRHTALFKSYIIPFLTLFPLYVRLLQCLRRSVESGNRWPHMGNALKYTSTILVLSFSIFQPRCRNSWYWIASFVAATLFQFLWDVFQDWGIVVIKYPDYLNAWQVVVTCSVRFQFRQQKLLGPLYIYIAVIVSNLVLRFAWALTLLPPPIDLPSAGSDQPASGPVYVFLFTHAAPIAASVEVLRRMVWGIFRLEQEQLEMLGDDTLLHSRDAVAASPSRSAADFEKMSTRLSSSALESEDDGGSSSVLSSALSALVGEPFFYAVLTFDWEALLPRFTLRVIDRQFPPQYKLSMANKLRFLESSLFIFLLVYTILCISSSTT